MGGRVPLRPSYNLSTAFAPTKNSSFEVSDNVIACDLWFASPQSKILATPMLAVQLHNYEMYSFFQHFDVLSLTQAFLHEP